MTLACCPSCGDQVRIPNSISGEATLRCPLCLESFEAGRIISSLPPELEVVNDPGAPVLPVAGTAPVAAVAVEPAGLMIDVNIDSSSSETGFQSVTIETNAEHESSPDDALPAFEFEEADAPQRDSPAFGDSISGSTSAAARRRAAKQPSPLPQILGVLLGGLAAIPLAQLVLWWIIGTDPAGAGPLVAKIVPFVVPKDFRGSESERDSEVSSRDDDRNSRRQTSRRPGRSLLDGNRPTPFEQGNLLDANRQNGSSLDDGNSDDTSSDQSTQTDDGGSNDDDRDPVSNGGLLGGNSSIPDVTGSGEDGGYIQPWQPPPIDPAFVDLADPHQALREIQTTDSTEIYELLQDILDGHEVWSTAATEESPERSEALDQYYHSLCELGESLLFIDPEDVRTEQAAYSVQATLETNFQDEESQKLRKFLSNRAARLLQQPTDLVGSGVALTGTLVSFEREGDYLRNIIRLDDVGRTEIVVYGWHQPPRVYIAGCKVVIFGGRLSNPEETLGIAAETNEVIAGSFLMVTERSPDDPTLQNGPRFGPAPGENEGDTG